MFQFRRFPTIRYLFHVWLLRYCHSGFPHSDISGSKPICGSPKLFAAYHVLLRLLMPRHSPCALHSLTSFVQALVWFSELCKLHKKVFLLAKLYHYPIFCSLLLLLYLLIIFPCSVFKVQSSVLNPLISAITFVIAYINRLSLSGFL